MSMTIDEEPLEELSGADAFPGERRRQITNLFVHAVLLLVMVGTVAVLAWVLVYVAGQGLKYLGPEFLTQTPPGNPSQPGGGFLNGIIGSLIVTGIATLLSMPVGIAAAIYLVEYGGRLARVTRFLTDILVGVPTIVRDIQTRRLLCVFHGLRIHPGLEDGKPTPVYLGKGTRKRRRHRPHKVVNLTGAAPPVDAPVLRPAPPKVGPHFKIQRSRLGAAVHQRRQAAP